MGLASWLREPITLDASAGERAIESTARVSVGMRPRPVEPEDDEPVEVVKRYRAAIPPVIIPRWRLLVPMAATFLGAALIVAAVAFVLVYFG